MVERERKAAVHANPDTRTVPTLYRKENKKRKSQKKGGFRIQTKSPKGAFSRKKLEIV